ncbi:MAG: oxaloacetate decarboxylase subunit alpha, partial [Clostridia bacterium]|nr:oxaloacetate decarboxylase subunit alpha [Clostridia bacterium]
ERYKNVNGQFKDLVQGKYGKTPVPIDPAFRKKIIGNEKPVTCRPADLLEPELEKLRKECEQWCEQEEDVLSYAQFDRVAIKFFENRRNSKAGIDSEHFDSKNKVHPV